MPKHADLVGADLHIPKVHKTSHQSGGTDAIDVTGLSGAHVHYIEEHAVTAGEESSRIVNLVEGTYTTGNKSLAVYVNGVRIKRDQYAETSSSRVTFIAGVITEGDDIEFEYRK